MNQVEAFKEQWHILSEVYEQENIKQMIKHPIRQRADFYNQIYLKTEYWEQLQLVVLEYNNWICEKCGFDMASVQAGTKVWSIHHKTYKHLFKLPQEFFDLKCLCYKCHNKIHGC